MRNVARSAFQKADPAKTRPTLRKQTKEDIKANAIKDEKGDFIDPNSGKSVPKEGPFDYGHKMGNEWWKTRDRARAEKWTRKDVLEHENNPDNFQIEDPSSNRSHKYEAD